MAEPIAVEVFLSEAGVCLALPRGCGIDQADALRVDMNAQTLHALRNGGVLPVDFPKLSQAHCQAIKGVTEVAVGEFVPQGVVQAYMLRVV